MSKKTVTKKIISQTLAREGIPFNESEKIVNLFFDIIREKLEQKQKVVLSGVGTFKVHARPARTGRNPKTGEPVDIPEKKYIKFVPSKNFIQAINS